MVTWKFSSSLIVSEFSFATIQSSLRGISFVATKLDGQMPCTSSIHGGEGVPVGKSHKGYLGVRNLVSTADVLTHTCPRCQAARK